MKWYGYILIAAVLLIVLFSIQSTTVEEEVFTPTAQVVGVDQAEKTVAVGNELRYDLYVIGNEVLPVTYEATAGDTVVLTVADTGDYDEIDFQVPELGVVRRLSIGDEVEVEVPVEGDFDFFCMTCSPALQGNILVHE